MSSTIKTVPRHIAIIMDGNGRWARSRGLPRIKGHEAGAQAVRECVEGCGELKVELYDSTGKLVGTSSGDKRRGVVRVEVPLRIPPAKVPPAATLVEQPFAFFGPTLPEGTYTVKVTKGKETLTSTINVVVDPRAKSTPQDRALQRQTALKLYGMRERLALLVAGIMSIRDQARDMR